ncbi:hypothetical protein KKI23_02235 [Patescibacteria group bacterium]|nr:hypothetical protein [Patescibacteria group bacterium]
MNILDKLKNLLAANYKKVIIILLLVFSFYTLYFLYQSYYLTMIAPEPADLTAYEQQRDKTNDKMYQSVLEEIKQRQKIEIDLNSLKNPFSN